MRLLRIPFLIAALTLACSDSSGPDDDSELFGVISRCEILGLHLISLRKLTPGDPP